MKTTLATASAATAVLLTLAGCAGNDVGTVTDMNANSDTSTTTIVNQNMGDENFDLDGGAALLNENSGIGENKNMNEQENMSDEAHALKNENTPRKGGVSEEARMMNDGKTNAAVKVQANVNASVKAGVQY